MPTGMIVDGLGEHRELSPPPCESMQKEMATYASIILLARYGSELLFSSIIKFTHLFYKERSNG
jgi:hypothetical protein